MKKSTVKKLSFRAVAIAQLATAAGGRTLTWTCYSVIECDTKDMCHPDAPGGTVQVTDSCNGTSCLSC